MTTFYELEGRTPQAAHPYRRYQQGWGHAVFATYLLPDPDATQLGVRLRAEYAEVFPPCMGEGR